MKLHPDASLLSKKAFETLEERFRYIHKDKYDYSGCIYLNSKTKMKIYCKEHKEYFYQNTNHHIKGKGCPKCGNIKCHLSRVLTTEEFITKAKGVHNDMYDYVNSKYVNSKTKLEIYCKKHNSIFWQIPANHLQGKGCPECAKECRQQKRSKGLDTFIDEASLKYKNKYDYSLVEYINGKTEVNIICPIHGEFTQSPEVHLISVYGCPECFNDLRGSLLRNPVSDFLNNAKNKFKDKFKYDTTEYINMAEKITIHCPIHGEFTQSPTSHMNSNFGCPECGRLESKKKYFSKPTILYYIKIIKNNKEYYKIGITSKTVYDRFQYSKKLDNIELKEVVSKVFKSGKPAYQIEQQILREFNHLKTQDKVITGGNSEVFDKDIYQHIKHHFQ